ncbi:MAG: NHLP-related RiPP peptide [Dokdonella sp.]|nr:NHLP-related RiPP peptide [Dokdonella sp.]
MKATRLPKEHELHLLKKLSTDDEYRARFEKSPSDALREIGVPDSAMADLDPATLKPGKLADKDAIADAHKKLDQESLLGHACMVFPMLRVDYGAPGSGKPS